MQESYWNILRIEKRRHGGISVNIILSIFVLTVVICITTNMLNSGIEFQNENTSLYKNDYESEKSICSLKINLYEIVEEAYNNTKDASEFEGCFKSVDSEYIRKVLSMYFFRDINTEIEMANGGFGDRSIVVEAENIYLYLSIKYTEGEIFRSYKKKCRIINPYIRNNIDVDNKKNLNVSELKKLVIID